MLCQKCSGIHFTPLERSASERPGRLVNLEPIRYLEQLYYLHHDSRQALQRSAEEGCHLCCMILSRAIDDLADQVWDAVDDDDSGIVIWRYCHHTSSTEDEFEMWNQRGWIDIQLPGYRLRAYTFDRFESPIAEILQALSNPAIPTPTDPQTLHDASVASELVDNVDDKADVLATLLNNIYSSEPDNSTTSPASLALASGWLQVCEKTHRPCKEYQVPGYCPNLLIDVRDPSNPKLSRCNNDAGAYVTLSYMWGKCLEWMDYRTTTSNVRRRETAGILLEELPRTIRDAIDVSSALGFQWLWVDALCIVQDDPEKQSVFDSMGLIFRGSALTLFAAVGADADAGLSTRRDPRSIRPCPLKLKITWNGSTRDEEVYLILPGLHRGNEPLFERGWVLQEQILATRGLYFGEKYISWRCACGHASELDPRLQSHVTELQRPNEGNPRRDDQRTENIDDFQPFRAWLLNLYETEDQRTLRTKVEKANGGFSIHKYQRVNHYDFWYSMVTRYSSRQLTHVEDVLPAVAGLANAIATVQNCEYILGLWKEDLHIGLVWYVAGGDSDADRPDDVASRNKPVLIYPSWTWPPQWGNQIVFLDNPALYVSIEALRVRVSWEEPQRSRCGSVPTPSSKSTSLQLTGKARLARTVSMENEERVLQCDDTREFVGTLFADNEANVAMGDLVLCLLCNACVEYEYDKKIGLNCLVLHPTNFAHDEYVRIGVVRIEKSDWFGSVDGYREVDRDTKPDKSFWRTITLF